MYKIINDINPFFKNNYKNLRRITENEQHVRSCKSYVYSKRNRVPKDLSTIKLLLVSDNIPLLIAQEKYFKEQGIHVYTAFDGDMGVRTFEYTPVGYINIILTDIWMKRMDGDAMARNIRALDRLDAETVIIIGNDGLYMESELMSYKESGIDGFFPELISIEALSRLLQKLELCLD